MLVYLSECYALKNEKENVKTYENMVIVSTLFWQENNDIRAMLLSVRKGNGVESLTNIFDICLIDELWYLMAVWGFALNNNVNLY